MSSFFLTLANDPFESKALVVNIKQLCGVEVPPSDTPVGQVTLLKEVNQALKTQSDATRRYDELIKKTNQAAIEMLRVDVVDVAEENEASGCINVSVRPLAPPLLR